ncbi:MAG: efflux RND transporter periplasmic adaptor subunit [Pseudomonadota bacterium]
MAQRTIKAEVCRYVAACFVATSLLAACDDGDQAQSTATAAPAPSVVVAPVVERDVKSHSTFVGRTVAVDYVELSAQVEGYLEERLFTEGQLVVPGDLLFTIDPRTFAAAVESAEASVAKAQASVTENSSQLERTKELYSTQDVSKARLDQDTASFLQAQADLQVAQAELKQAQVDLDFTRITAPITGQIGEATYSIGNLITSSSDPLATITSLDPIYVSFTVSERDILQVKRLRLANGEDATFDTLDGLETMVVPMVELPDGKMYEHPGVIDFVDNTVDPRTGTVTVRAVFPNPNVLLSPGQFVSVLIESREATKRMVIPQAAVQEDQQGPFVLVVNAQNQVEKRQIQVGATEGVDWIVTSGLNVGELVIVEGLQKVRAGIAVNPVQQSSTDQSTTGQSSSGSSSSDQTTSDQSSGQSSSDQTSESDTTDQSSADQSTTDGSSSDQGG